MVQSNLEQIKPGAIFCIRPTEDYQNKLKNNILYPYFLVYVSQDGEEIIGASQTKLALDYYRKLCMGNDGILPDLIEELEIETKSNKNMDAYVQLLQKSIKEVVGVKEEVGLDSLATAGGTDLFGESKTKKDTLELVSYLIVK